ncbi:urease accessory protein UreD [Sedimentitalea sp. HM32M-2]|uniref:urease accessory protein UreD n=1 Tax=Sedimentitalea sp. HM32M-2 TaxID=3351566 RepID=UPI003624D32E
MTCHTAIANAATPACQPRARGTLRLSTKLSGNSTVLDGLRQAGALKGLFPRGAGGALQAVTLNTAGGITGGDRLSVAMRAAPGTTLTVTTQACERIYRAQPGQTGHVRNRVRIADGARVNWLPQETLLYDGGALRRSLTVDMATDASLLLVEPMVFGRAAMGETLTDIRLDDRIEIRRAGQPLYLDAQRLQGDAAAHLRRPVIADSAGAMVALVFVAAAAAAHLDAVRAALPATGGASLIRDDVMVLRLLAADSFELRQVLLPVLQRLLGGDLPRCWMI